MMAGQQKQDDIDRIWLKSYEEGMPHTIDPDIETSLVGLFEKSFETYKHKSAYSNMGVKMTFQELDEASKAFAGFLQKTAECAPGDRIAIMMPNLLQYPIALMGVLRAKMIVVNVNPLYTARELDRVLKDSGATAIVVLANFAHIVEEVLKDTSVKTVVVTEIGDMFPPIKRTLVNLVVKHVKKMVPAWNIPNAIPFKDAINAKHIKNFSPVPISNSDTAFLQYTGGTTGIVKGAILTHRNMVANLMQAQAWIRSLIPHDVQYGIVTALPLYHIFSLTANCFTFFTIGAENILITNPRDIKGFVKELKLQPFSVITGVNTLFNALLHDPEFKKVDFSKLKLTLGGGMAVQKAVADKWHEVTGCVLLEAYGLTETSPAVTVNPLYLKKYNGSIGLPVPSTDVKICNDQGQAVPLGDSGELWVRAPQVMQGYWHRPEETEAVFTGDWLHTGDIARMDDKGFIYIVDRKKDVIIVSGFNVYPNEVEDVIAGLDVILEVAVVGVPNAEHGELVKAYIVSEDPELTAEQVIAHCRKGLTPYKVPHQIEFRKELPKSNVGKVLRRILRDEETNKQ